MFFVASDHAGFELKAKLVAHYQNKLKIQDLGTDSSESCDYPTYARVLCERVLKEPGSLGLLICGTGIGMSIAANKIAGIRAAAVSEPQSARMSREHNNANVLCVGARVIQFDRAVECVDAFLSAKFDTSNPRHQRRVSQIADLERC